MKTKTIDEFRRSSLKKEVLQFLGLRRFYRKFVPNFSSVLAQLTVLLKKNMKFWWTEQRLEAFEKLKMLTTAPVLTMPNFLKPFKVTIDAVMLGVGDVLLQEDDYGIERPI
eukprot:g30495.t1